MTKSDAADISFAPSKRLLSGDTFFGGPEKPESGEKTPDRESYFDSTWPSLEA